MKLLQRILTDEMGPLVLIEANAGTGKTYTIQGLFIRHLLEKNLHVSQILVVTFTKLATKELRSRILQKLQEARKVLQTGESGGDAVLDELLGISAQYPNATELLTDAIRNFDDASIFTIHGYCQKLLTDFSVYTETLSDFSVQQGYEQHLMVTENYWRSLHDRFSSDEFGRFYLSILLQHCSTPEALLQHVRPFIEKNSFSTLESETFDSPSEEIAETFYQLKKRAIQLFELQKESILQLFHEHTPARFAGSRIRDVLPFVSELFNHGTNKTREKVHYFSELRDKHPFFDLVHQLEQQIPKMDFIVADFYRTAAEEIRKLYEILGLKSDTYHYQDLLQKASDAITEGKNREELLTKIRSKWPVALVDEFQDTDPLQFRLFSTIYDGTLQSGHLCMIGDPKQAIYSFRGADVYTYLQAKTAVSDKHHFALNRNFRSSRTLIEAVNRLIGEDSFQMKGLTYEPSSPGTTISELTLDQKAIAPVQLSEFRFDQKLSKEKIEFEIFGEVIRQIQELLSLIQDQKLKIGDRLVKPSDIVVLLQSNQSIRTLQNRLSRIGIGSVSLTKESIYSTREATLILAMMRSFLYPYSSAQGILHAAGFFPELADHTSLNLKTRISELDLEKWTDEGFYSAFYSFMTRNRIWEALIRGTDGERSISNLQQLATEIQKAQQEGAYSTSHMVYWLKQRMIHADSKREEEENDLETDEDRIKLMTLHKSKGLQFPIVFCPDLWKGSSPRYDKGGFISYHSDTFETILNISPKDSPTRKEARIHVDKEKKLEQIRTAYVGITRAEQQVRLFWTNSKDFEISGLYGLIKGAASERQSTTSTSITQSTEDSALVSEYIKNLSTHSDLFKLSSFTKEIPQQDEQTFSKKNVTEFVDPNLQFSAEIYQGSESLDKWNRYTESFTSLHNRIQSGYSGESTTTYDIVTERSDEVSTTLTESPFHLPKGAKFGSFFHKVTEDPQFEFSSFDPDDDSYQNWIAQITQKEGYSAKIIPALSESLTQLTQVELPGLQCKQIKPDDQIREMEFYLPFQNVDASLLLNLIRNRKEQPRQIPTDTLQGFLTGFIDLVVIHNGKVWIIDYKTNYLGDQFEAYTREKLQESVMESLYDVQYTLYTVALKRYLERYLPGYHHERDFMGVAYLYVRALKKGSDFGIWIDRPEDSLVTSIEQIWINTQKDEELWIS